MRGQPVKLPLGVNLKTSVDLGRYLPYRIYKLSALIALPRTVATENGGTLRVREWRVLLILAGSGPQSASDIARMSFMDTGSTARAVRELLASGLIVSRPDPRDRRKQVLTISQKGADTFDEAYGQRCDYLRALLAPLSSADVAMLFQLLDKVEQSAVSLAADDADPFSEE